MDGLYESEREQVKEHLVRYPFHPDLKQFREASEQQKVLKETLENEKTHLAIAFTDSCIIGYAILLPPDSFLRWSTYSFIYELGALEVIPDYRGCGVAKQLLHNLFSHRNVEDKIVIALEYYWHWDLSNQIVSPYRYKAMLHHVLSSVDFVEIKTDEEDIVFNPINFMMARFGQNVPFKQVEQFLQLSGDNNK